MKILGLLFLLQSCAIVHHVQVGEIKQNSDYVKMPFELKISETGVDIQEFGDLANSMSGQSQDGQNVQSLAEIISLFQMGPRTGKPIYNEKYADSIARAVYQKCPSGNITGLVMVREMNSYPVVSGEIVKVHGYCLQKKTKRKNKRKS